MCEGRLALARFLCPGMAGIKSWCSFPATFFITRRLSTYVCASYYKFIVEKNKIKYIKTIYGKTFMPCLTKLSRECKYFCK